MIDCGIHYIARCKIRTTIQKNQNKKDRNKIPGQGVEVWQEVESVLEPWQYLPSPCGRGLSQSRVRVMWPSLHVTSHAAHALHAPQKPSTDITE